MGSRRGPECRLGLAGAALCLLAGSAHAQAFAHLATAPGDGSVVFDIDAYGAFGYQTYGNGQRGLGDAIYDPVGGIGPSSTSWQTGVYMRMPPSSTFLTVGHIGQTPTTGGLPDPGFISQDGTTARSAFSFGGLDWELQQNVQDLIVGGNRVGTMLVQQYVMRNPGLTTINFGLVRYYEGDLYLGLGAGVPDGGGHLFVGPEELVFETDKAGEPADSTNLVGITACGGTTPARGRSEVNQWPAFPGRINTDQSLGDVVYQDGVDPDEFVDTGLDYDVGIALDNEFSVGPGQSALYVTTTVFGQLPPAGVSQGCAMLAQAVAEAGPDQTACPGAIVTLDGSASFDSDIVPGTNPITWQWDFDTSFDSSGNGVPDDDVDASGQVVSGTFPVGTTTVQLTFTDDDGDVDTDTVDITIQDTLAPVVSCPNEIQVDATSFSGGPASPSATATDDCDPNPTIRNDRTAGGADASDSYPCGTTLVTFYATDSVGNESSCTTTVRVVPGPTSFPVGAALRVTKDPGGHPVLDWSRVGVVPPEIRFAVLRGTARVAPTAIAPGANNLPATTWTDPDLTGALVYYNVRSDQCDGSLSDD